MAQGAMRVTNQADYLFTWGAIAIADGWASDDAIIVDQNADDFTYEAGIGGEVGVMQMKDATALITVRLQEGSPANAQLAAYRLLALSGAAPKAPPVLAKTTGSQFTGAKCICLGPPKQVKFGAKVEVKEWRFLVTKLVRVDGFIPAE